jgi:hypothetical protein
MTSASPGRWFSHCASKARFPPDEPLPVPLTDAAIATGPLNFSVPVPKSNA